MVPTNVLHALAGSLHQFRFCSLGEYSANLIHAQHPTNVCKKQTGRIGSSTRSIKNSHHRRIRRCVLNCTAGCFAISMRGNYSRWEHCLHAGGAVVQLCREISVCWPQCSSMGSFCGLRYNPIRIQRLFLPTFSGKAEKVGLRSNGCGVTARTAVRCKRTKGPMCTRKGWAASVALLRR